MNDLTEIAEESVETEDDTNKPKKAALPKSEKQVIHNINMLEKHHVIKLTEEHL